MDADDGPSVAYWNDDGTLTVDPSPEGHDVTITWRIYDGLAIHEVDTEVVAGSEVHLDVDSLPDAVDTSSRLSLRPWVRVHDASGLEIADTKLAPRTFETAEGLSLDLAIEETGTAPGWHGGRRTSQIAVASRRTTPPLPPPVMDNDDKLFDQTGAPVSVLDDDMSTEPMPTPELEALLARFGKSDRLAEVQAAQAEAALRKAEATAAGDVEVTP